MFDGLLTIDPAWAGKVQFYELLFGTWTSYVFMVWLWKKALGKPLPEWKYALLVFMGAGAFWINHYFQYSGRLWLWLINLYTVFYLIAWWYVGMRGEPRRWTWRLGALVGAVAYTIVFILCEQLSRLGVERFGMHEFCFMFISYFGFIWLIVWRGRRTDAA